VFCTNPLSDTVSSYTLDGAGNLTLNDGAAGNTGINPSDIGISDDGLYLYTLDQGSDSLSTFRINADGSLTDLNIGPAVPASAVGMVAR
jgi:6-phosphogluconolactonase (cycloisomerase 2 family)